MQELRGVHSYSLNISHIVNWKSKVKEGLFVHISFIEHFVIWLKLIDLIERAILGFDLRCSDFATRNRK